MDRWWRGLRRKGPKKLKIEKEKRKTTTENLKLREAGGVRMWLVGRVPMDWGMEYEKKGGGHG